MRFRVQGFGFRVLGFGVQVAHTWLPSCQKCRMISFTDWVQDFGSRGLGIGFGDDPE